MLTGRWMCKKEHEMFHKVCPVGFELKADGKYELLNIDGKPSGTSGEWVLSVFEYEEAFGEKRWDGKMTMKGLKPQEENMIRLNPAENRLSFLFFPGASPIYYKQ
ncbi:hypothetical protein [Zavarzinella formosa]|uniref:hypothetical protein n=1 Tax=Zavarzinella formosa TaxID=360055 RepID=UPI000314970F|nr:hypothetical protein [Zavarzinella formosa]